MIFKRPWQIYPLLLIIVIFTTSNWARVWNSVQLMDFLNELPLSVSPWYLMISGAVWGLLGILAAVIMVWRGCSRAPWMVPLMAAAYSVNFWIEQLFIMVSPLRRVNWPFVIVADIIIVIFAFITFKQPGMGEFYGGRHEQEIQP